MAEEPLVRVQIEDGSGLVRRLTRTGLDVSAAFWGRPTERDWRTYIALANYDEHGRDPAALTVLKAAREFDTPELPYLDVNPIAAKNPLATGVMELLSKRQGPMHARLSKPLGNAHLEEVYAYWPESWKAPPTAKTRIVGIRQETSATATTAVEDEIGYVDGTIGDEEFNRKFADLVTAKFGSVARFHAAYPRVLLQRAS